MFRGDSFILFAVVMETEDDMDKERKFYAEEERLFQAGQSVKDFEVNTEKGTKASDTDQASSRGLKEKSKVSLFQYFLSELTRSYWLENDEARYSERREKVYTFVKMPRDVEKFILYGSLQCLDAFLFVFTFLPLRFLLALWFLMFRPCARLFGEKHPGDLSPRVLEPSEICDILKSVTLLASSFLMTYVDTSMLYHLIKSQSVIKLYIFFNMLEVADRLLSAFGQDVLDTLFWTATETKERKREHFGVIPHLLLAIIYVLIIQTMKEYNWKGERLFILLPDCLLVLVFEVVVDCIKHAFITRFNEIPTEVYHEYTVSLAYDLACSKHKNAFSDHSDLVARRMGFIPLPLSVLIFRITSQSVSVNGIFGVFLVILAYICLVSLKLLNSVVILGKACNLIEEYQRGRSKKAAPPQRSKSHPPSRKPSDTQLVPPQTSKSLCHSRNPSYTGSLTDVASLLESQPPLGPQPIYCNSSVSLNSLGLNEGLLIGRHGAGDSMPDLARKVSLADSPVSVEDDRAGSNANS